MKPIPIKVTESTACTHIKKTASCGFTEVPVPNAHHSKDIKNELDPQMGYDHDMWIELGENTVSSSRTKFDVLTRGPIGGSNVVYCNVLYSNIMLAQRAYIDGHPNSSCILGIRPPAIDDKLMPPHLALEHYLEAWVLIKKMTLAKRIQWLGSGMRAFKDSRNKRKNKKYRTKRKK